MIKCCSRCKHYRRFFEVVRGNGIISTGCGVESEMVYDYEDGSRMIKGLVDCSANADFTCGQWTPRGWYVRLGMKLDKWFEKIFLKKA